MALSHVRGWCVGARRSRFVDVDVDVDADDGGMAREDATEGARGSYSVSGCCLYARRHDRDAHDVTPMDVANVHTETVRWLMHPTAAYAGPAHPLRRHYASLMATDADAVHTYETTVHAVVDAAVDATRTATLEDMVFDFEAVETARCVAMARDARATCVYPRLTCKHWLLSSMCMKGRAHCPFRHSIAEGTVPPACDAALCRRMDCVACALAFRRTGRAGGGSARRRPSKRRRVHRR